MSDHVIITLHCFQLEEINEISMSALENNTRLRFMPMKYVFLQSMTEYHIHTMHTLIHTHADMEGESRE